MSTSCPSRSTKRFTEEAFARTPLNHLIMHGSNHKPCGMTCRHQPTTTHHRASRTKATAKKRKRPTAAPPTDHRGGKNKNSNKLGFPPHNTPDRVRTQNVAESHSQHAIGHRPRAPKRHTKQSVCGRWDRGAPAPPSPLRKRQNDNYQKQHTTHPHSTGANYPPPKLPQHKKYTITAEGVHGTVHNFQVGPGLCGLLPHKEKNKTARQRSQQEKK